MSDATPGNSHASRNSQMPTLDPTTASDRAKWIEVSTQDNRPQLTKIGPYKLLQVIGEGGFGTVCIAEQQRAGPARASR